ncbi:hypothetical protein P3T40_007260 [Paraburkholderia sp. EB58]|jgi:hypothetical protein
MAEQAGRGPNASASLSACRVRLNMSNRIAGIERAEPAGPRACPPRKDACSRPQQAKSSLKVAPKRTKTGAKHRIPAKRANSLLKYSAL